MSEKFNPEYKQLPAHSKPLLTAEQQIAHLKAKGITFQSCREVQAAEYLKTGNNYLRTASYRKLYPRRQEGSDTGRYVSLDFGDLIQLSSIDRQLREAFLGACMDVEHFAKLKVLSLAEDHSENGYTIVQDFFASLTHDQRKRVRSSLSRRAAQGEGHDTYTGDLIAHYGAEEMPLWVLVEVLEFGPFLTLYKFCAERWSDGVMAQEHYVLKSVKALRNACAHNSCIINGFNPSSGPVSYQTNQLIVAALNAAGMKNTKARKAKLRNVRIAQMAAALYAADHLCARESTRKRNLEKMIALKLRMAEHSNGHVGDGSLSSLSSFFARRTVFGGEAPSGDEGRRSLSEEAECLNRR